MKKLTAANDIRATHARGEQEVPAVPYTSIIIPETHEVAELLDVTISECEELASIAAVPAAVGDGKTESQHTRETIVTQLSEGQFTESLITQPMDKVMKGKQSLEQDGMQPGFNSVTGKDGVKVINGGSVKFGCFNGAQPYYVDLTDLVIDRDGNNMTTGFMQWDSTFSPWTLNYDEIDMILKGKLHVRYEGETMIAKVEDVMFVLKGSSIESGMPSTVKFLYVAWPANWQSC